MIDVYIVLGIMAIMLSAWGIDKYRTTRKKNKLGTIIPFKESIDLVGMPIVTFTNNGEKLHFLLDTGSDDSYIVPSILDKLLIINKVDIVDQIVTGGGSVETFGEVTLNISYKDYVFTNLFKINPMEDAFKQAFGDRSITVHGILGSIFFNKYNYILDFKELQATSSYGNKE